MATDGEAPFSWRGSVTTALSSQPNGLFAGRSPWHWRCSLVGWTPPAGAALVRTPG